MVIIILNLLFEKFFKKINFAKICLISSVILSSTLILSSCSLFSPVKVTAANKYMLTRIPANVATKKSHGKILFVMMPETQTIYNTTQMAYTTKRYQIAYFSRNQWGDTPAQMLQPLLIRTLQNTHHFRAVVSQSFSGRYDYILSTYIFRLQQNFTYCPARLELIIAAQLLNVSTNRVVATQLFSKSLPIVQVNPYAGVVAANYAMESILRDIAQFCLTHTL